MSDGDSPRLGGAESRSGAGLDARLKALTPAARARLLQQLNAQRPSGNSLLARALAAEGIRHLLAIAGTPMDRVLSLSAKAGIRLIGLRDQRAGVLMSAAANYITGRVDGVVMVSAGPAVTNTVTGLLTAQQTGWPVVVMGGRRALHQAGIGYFQELDAVPMLTPITKAARTAESPGRLPSLASHLIRLAATGRPGAVYLDLPEDVLEGKAEVVIDSADAPASDHSPRSEDLAAALAVLSRLDRPLLILGEALRWSLDRPALSEMVERLGLPFITTSLGRGLLPDDHPLCANVVRRAIQSRADGVLLAGASFDWRLRFGGGLAPQAGVIHADHEGPMLGRNVEGAARVPGDPGRTLAELWRACSTVEAQSLHRRWSPWRAMVQSHKAEATRVLRDWIEQRSSRITPQRLFAEIRDFLPDDAVVSVEGNVSLTTAQRVLCVRRPVSWLDPGWCGCMGVALPYAMGACLAEPGRPFVALCSDMGFALHAAEIETAVRHRLPVLVVIANNDGNTGSLRQSTHLPDHPERVWQYTPGLRYDRLAEALGAHGEYVIEPDELRPALDRAASAGRCAVVNVAVDPGVSHPGAW